MSFIDNYLDYSSGNEAPLIYHKWSALSVLSSAISRRVWYDSGFFILYPNLYIILVGEPAGGKTTAMDIARRMVQRLDIPVAPNASSREALIQLMSAENKESKCKKTFEWLGEKRDYSHISLFASEIVTTLSVGGNPLGFIECLTDIWDRELFEYRTKGGGTDMIVGPFLTLLGCMTPEQTDSMLKQSIITGGFSRRCIFVFSLDRGDPVPRPKLTERQKEAHAKCLRDLQLIQTRFGEFEFTKEAGQFFDTWYVENFKRRGQPLPAVMKNYLRSKDGLAIKMAMLLALSDNPTCKMFLEPTHLERAIKMLDEIEPSITKVFEGSGRNVLAEIAAKIVAMLEQAKKPVPLKQVYANLFNDGDRDEIAKAIHHLEETDRVSRSSVDKGGFVVGYQLSLRTDSAAGT